MWPKPSSYALQELSYTVAHCLDPLLNEFLIVCGAGRVYILDMYNPDIYPLVCYLVIYILVTFLIQTSIAVYFFVLAPSFVLHIYDFFRFIFRFNSSWNISSFWWIWCFFYPSTWRIMKPGDISHRKLKYRWEWSHLWDKVHHDSFLWRIICLIVHS